MSNSTSETDEFYAQIHRRMVESGEWDRIIRLLASRLSEYGWVDDMRHRAKDHARSMDALSLRLVLEKIAPSAQANIPAAVKREVTNMLKQYVKEQFEK